MARIEGNSGNLADVNEDKQLLVRAVTESDLAYASEAKGKAYSWSSTYAATGGEEIISVKNTSQTDCLIIDEIVVSNSVAGLFTIFDVSSGTAAGNTISGKNLNLGSGNGAAATAFGNASVTGSLSGSVISYASVAANAGALLDLRGALVLGQDSEIAITVGATGTVSCTIIGHYKAP